MKMKDTYEPGNGELDDRNTKIASDFDIMDWKWDYSKYQGELIFEKGGN